MNCSDRLTNQERGSSKPIAMSRHVSFNETDKIWKSSEYQNGDFVNQTVGETFLKMCARLGPNVVIEESFDTGKVKTVGELHLGAVTVAINLQSLDIQPGDVVIIYSNVNSKTSELILGSMMIGAQVNFFETHFGKEDAEYTIEYLSPTLIFYEDQHEDLIKAAITNIEVPNLKLILSIDSNHKPHSVEKILFKPVSQDVFENFQLPSLGNPQEVPAALVLTSGSTGRSKAVVLSHSLLLHGSKTFWWNAGERCLLRSDSVVCSFSPLRWITHIAIMLQSLLMGVKRVYSITDDMETCLEMIRKCKVTHVFTVPSFFNDIQMQMSDEDYDTLSSLKVVFLGGEIPFGQVLEKVRNKARNAKVCLIYGMTEFAGGIATDERINGGVIMPGLEVKILNDDLLAVGRNVKGQLCIKLPIPYLGYYKVDNSPEYLEDGFFNTGDYAFIDESNMLHILGRYKDLIRAKGLIMIPSEVEAITSKVPYVASASLIRYRKCATASEDSGALFVTLSLGCKESETTVRANICYILDSKLTPVESHIVKDIYVVKKLPLTMCGKLDKVALRSMAKAHA